MYIEARAETEHMFRFRTASLPCWTIRERENKYISLNNTMFSRLNITMIKYLVVLVACFASAWSTQPEQKRYENRFNIFFFFIFFIYFFIQKTNMLFARCSQFRANVLRPLKLGMYASLHCLIYVKVCYSDKVKRGVFYRSNLFINHRKI